MPLRTDPSTVPVVVIAGPTASGKTDLGIALAASTGGWVLSADSRMVYQGLDIGSGKPTWEYRTQPVRPWLKPDTAFSPAPTYLIQGIRHFGLDVVAPDSPWTLADWLTLAKETLRTISQHRPVVFVVGGTGLYLKALIEGYSLAPTDPVLRAELERLPTDDIRARLMVNDPETAQRETANRRRLIRALEVLLLTGQPMSVARIEGRLPHVLMLALEPATPELRTRIVRRLKSRMKMGLVEEIQGLIRSGVSAEWLEGLGLEYRHLTRYLTGRFRGTENELEDKLVGDIIRFAHRQKTFLRTQLQPVLIHSVDEADRLVRNFLKG